jgi:hypothetical protein
VDEGEGEERNVLVRIWCASGGEEELREGERRGRRQKGERKKRGSG